MPRRSSNIYSVSGPQRTKIDSEIGRMASMPDMDNHGELSTLLAELEGATCAGSGS